jgi:integrase
MGELRLRGRIWWVRYYRDGRRFEESSGSAKESDAKRLLRLREGDIERGLPVSPKIGRLRYDEAAQDLLNDYTTNKRRSLQQTQGRLTLHLTPFFGGRRMSSITTSDVREYVAQRQAERVEWGSPDDRRSRPVSNGAINRELTLLKRMFRLALQAGKLLAVPHIPLLRENNVRKGFFEREQFEAVRRHLPEYARPIVTFAYYTGWRIDSEVLPLEWRQVDLQAGTVRLDPGTTKNDEGRVFMAGLIDELRETLEAQRESAKRIGRERGEIARFVFSRNGERVRTFRKAWANACLAAACPGRIPHDFRRTAVRNLVRAGVPERVAMLMTGHKTRSVFERYNIVSDNDLAEASRKLNAALSLSRRTNAI